MMASANTELRPVAIAVAPNGGRRGKTDHPQLPMNAQEIAATAATSADAGAAMLHCHARDGDGKHILDADAYREILHAVRTEVGERLLVQVTTEAVSRYAPDEQMAVVRALRPEAASLALAELVPDRNHERAFGDFLAFMRRERIIPQIILYNPDEALALHDLMLRGVVPFDDIPVLYVLGRYSAGQRSAPADLLPFLAAGQPRFGHFMVCAFGPREAACVTAAATLGGHVRVGFENNLYRPDGRFAADNAENVRTVAETLALLGLEAADAERLRTDWAISAN